MVNTTGIPGANPDMSLNQAAQRHSRSASSVDPVQLALAVNAVKVATENMKAQFQPYLRFLNDLA